MQYQVFHAISKKRPLFYAIYRKDNPFMGKSYISNILMQNPPHSRHIYELQSKPFWHMAFSRINNNFTLNPYVRWHFKHKPYYYSALYRFIEDSTYL